jgi:hypothetical protein
VNTAPLPWLSSGKEQPCYVPAGAWGWMGKWRDEDGSTVRYSWSPGPSNAVEKPEVPCPIPA